MLSIADQTAGPIGPTFLWTLKKIDLKKKFHGQRRALQLVYHKSYKYQSYYNKITLDTVLFEA